MEPPLHLVERVPFGLQALDGNELKKVARAVDRDAAPVGLRAVEQAERRVVADGAGVGQVANAGADGGERDATQRPGRAPCELVERPARIDHRSSI
ncbi:MAG TPA: hypothetical protein VFS00_20380 [Polyangiaceae bacterium]|nr:hypothetical protein [Polyangiaceae bacterium]